MGDRTPRPAYENNFDTASNGATPQFYPINEDLPGLPSRQVYHDRQTDRTPRPSYENNFDTANTSNGALCEACKETVNAIRRAEMVITDEQALARRVNKILNNNLCYDVDPAEYLMCLEKGDLMRNLGAGANPTAVCINIQYCHVN